MCKIICVTNRLLCSGDYLDQIEKIARGKPDIIILREKDLTPIDYERLARKVKDICNKYDVRCILHSFVDIAIDLQIDAIHLPMAKLREMNEEQKKSFSVIGASCHSLEEVLEAQGLGATYVTAGHVFETKCKEGVPPRGIPFFKEICEQVSISVFALGGITLDNSKMVCDAGAAGICIMSGFMKEKEPEQLIKQLRMCKSE